MPEYRLTAETCESAVKVSEAEAVLPLSEAVICAAPSVVNDPAVAVKLAVVAPAMAVTDAGTETLALLELRATAAPDPVAGLLRVTTHVDFPTGLNVAGLQLNPLTIADGCTIVMLPEPTETGTLAPPESERTTCVTWIADDGLVVPGDRAKVN